MRPQDIVILVKILSEKNNNWRNIDIAKSVMISASEVTEALNRCKIAGLLDSKKRNINTNSLKEFLIYGLKYVFPVEPGGLVRGIPTAHSADPINKQISSNDIYVWPYAKGDQRGQAIEPLYRTIPLIVEQNKLFYELLAIIDTFRIGRVREINIAKIELEKRINNA